MDEKLRRELLILEVRYQQEKCPKKRHKIYVNIQTLKELLGIDTKDAKNEYSALIFTRW